MIGILIIVWIVSGIITAWVLVHDSPERKAFWGVLDYIYVIILGPVLILAAVIDLFLGKVEKKNDK